MQLAARSDWQAMVLLALFVFAVTLCDRIIAVNVGATTVFLGPGGESLGLGAAFIFLPLVIFALPLSLAASSFSSGKNRLHWLAATILLRALIPLTSAFPAARELLCGSQPAVGMTLSGIFLLGQLTLATTFVQLRATASRPLPYLCLLTCGFFLGQWSALRLAPYLVSQPPGDYFNLLLCGIYILATALAYLGFKCLQDFKDKEDLARLAIMPNSDSTDKQSDIFALTLPVSELRPWQLARFLLATVALYLPLFAPIFISLLFSIECNQAGTLIISTLSANLSLACAVGALLSVFLNKLARKRIILQVVALVALSQYFVGAWSHNSVICYTTLTAMAAIAGLILPDWYHHLLTHLSLRQLPHFLAAKDTVLVLVYALCTIPIEQTLAVASSLYFLKELNLLGAGLTVISILIAPLVLRK